MDKALLIVESPAKAKTINKYLGSGYRVMASMGHVRDLPKSKLGVDVDKDFEPQYIIIPEREKVVGELRAAARTASSIILAADPDREGEAICWHLKAIFDDGKKPVFRVRLQEITKQAVEDAVRHMGELNVHMFEAQQARRVLDRLVGYKISPLLWKKIGRGLSAGRVQSIALRLVVEREREIRAFRKEEFWTIFAYLEASLPPPVQGGVVQNRRKESQNPRRRLGSGDRRCAERRPLCRPRRRRHRKEEESAAALYHQHSSAGSFPASPLPRQEDDVRRPEALRGASAGRTGADGPHHLHAH
jgi:DNA topoisomerase I (EC 5.99.1.2)